ncbi:hypothetical protein 2F5_5 [uncultured Caudovirales phage]|uniref:Uncharacterized protein n=1 Tax=uncultured Caudovirales phage TaxID=2100421 RepID=A0A2H4JEG8_9CAUD|nr:hypothetical protein 2F5_5 [uncultured Caudovirales phage]
MSLNLGGVTMAYHFNNKIEIIEERDDPNAFMLGENMITTVIAKP